MPLGSSNPYPKCPNCGKHWIEYTENASNAADEYKEPVLDMNATVRFYCGGAIHMKNQWENKKYTDKDRAYDSAQWSPVCPKMMKVPIPCQTAQPVEQS